MARDPVWPTDWIMWSLGIAAALAILGCVVAFNRSVQPEPPAPATAVIGIISETDTTYMVVAWAAGDTLFCEPYDNNIIFYHYFAGSEHE